MACKSKKRKKIIETIAPVHKPFGPPTEFNPAKAVEQLVQLVQKKRPKKKVMREDIIEAIIEAILAENTIAPPSSHKNWGLIGTDERPDIPQTRSNKVKSVMRFFS